jgi:hypothetical protein
MVGSATAQQRPKIETLSLFVAEPGTVTELEVRVGPPEAMPKNGYVRIRGLPTAATLSDSFVVTPGVWSVPLAALGTLRVTLPKGVSGRSELTLSLLDVDGRVLAETRSALVVAQVNLRAAIAPEPKSEAKPELKSEAPPPAKIVPKPEPPRQELPKVEMPKPVPKPAPVVEAPPAPLPEAKQEPSVQRSAKVEPIPPASSTQAALPAPSPEARQRNARMVEQGDKALALGNIATARQFFLRAAEAGDGSAALKLAETYDPAELPRLNAKGMAGDVAEAKRWYERARDLGVAGTAEKLARLSGR